MKLITHRKRTFRLCGGIGRFSKTILFSTTVASEAYFFLNFTKEGLLYKRGNMSKIDVEKSSKLEKS